MDDGVSSALVESVSDGQVKLLYAALRVLRSMLT